MSTAHSIVGQGKNRAPRDFYPTPPHATDALMKREKFVGTIWEPACGDGAMLDVIRKYHPAVGTDIVSGIDFLKENALRADNIITNPPYNLAEQFIAHAKNRSTRKIAMLLKLAFLEGRRRYAMFQDKQFPLKTVYVFSKRITFHPQKLDDKKTGGMIAFAWFVWDAEYCGPTTIEWIQ